MNDQILIKSAALGANLTDLAEDWNPIDSSEDALVLALAMAVNNPIFEPAAKSLQKWVDQDMRQGDPYVSLRRTVTTVAANLSKAP